jgi:glycogen debranching enzyme
MTTDSPFLAALHNRINLTRVPFSDRGSRLMIFRKEESLYIRLAERWFKLDGQLSSYRSRRPIVSDLVFTDGDGQPQPFTQESWPDHLEFTTPQGLFRLTFVDNETVLLALPAGRVGVSFVCALDSAQSDRRGGTLRRDGDIRRNIAYTTNAHLLRNEIEATDDNAQRVRLVVDSEGGRSLLINITPRLGFNRSIPAQAEAFAAAARAWHEWFAAAPPVLDSLREQYLYAWWIMRAGLISTRFYTTREAMTPSKIHYVGVWQWDAYFHALAYRHVDSKLARDQIRIVLDHQRADGMIPDAIHDEGVVSHLTFPLEADVTKPPLLAWTAWKLYELDGDVEFLDEIYEGVARWNRWWFAHNGVEGSQLCAYRHPFSSGLDDSPLWDAGMPVESPDLNSYLVMQMDALARMAQVLGMADEAASWSQQADQLAQAMVDSLWSEEAGLFLARREGALLPVRSPVSFFPMLTGRLPDALCDRLVATLTDERSFWPRYPVPSVALDDPTYNPLQMWRGPTWLNVNYLLCEALECCGYGTWADLLRQRSLEMVQSTDDIYEYYHPETGEIPPKAAPLFGWSASVFIEMAIQETARQGGAAG